MNVQTTEFANGLTVISHAMPHLQTVSVGVWVGAGSRNEGAHEHGIAHFLEHMAFKGTETRTAQGIAEEIEQVGAYLNAHTSHEATAYHVRALSEDLPLAVDLLGDILLHSRFDEVELERERGVILQEIRQVADMPDDLVFDEFLSAAFPGQAIGRPILGTNESVGSFGQSHLRTYMREHYHGPVTVLSAAGAVDHDELVALAERHLSDLPVANAASADAARFVGGEYRQVKDLEQAHLILGFDGPAQKAEDYFTAQVYSGVLGGGMSSRLFQELRERRGLCYSVFSFGWSFADAGVMGVYAATDEDSVEELSGAMIDELHRVVEDVTETEIVRAKAQSKAGLLMSLESSAARAEQLARQRMIYGRALETEELVAQLDAVEIADVKRFAESLLTRSAPALAAYGPVSRLPAYEKVKERLA